MGVLAGMVRDMATWKLFWLVICFVGLSCGLEFSSKVGTEAPSGRRILQVLFSQIYTHSLPDLFPLYLDLPGLVPFSTSFTSQVLVAALKIFVLCRKKA